MDCIYVTGLILVLRPARERMNSQTIHIMQQSGGNGMCVYGEVQIWYIWYDYMFICNTQSMCMDPVFSVVARSVYLVISDHVHKKKYLLKSYCFGIIMIHFMLHDLI